MLMNDELKSKLIGAYEKECSDYENYVVDEQKVIVKYYHQPSGYTLFAINGEDVGDDIILFGYVISPICKEFNEYGSVALSELESIPLMEMDTDIKGVLGDYTN